jgi:hypothetical protein
MISAKRSDHPVPPVPPTEKYAVTVRLSPSLGGQVQRLVVDAIDVTDAIVRASIELDNQGKERWALIGWVRVTS